MTQTGKRLSIAVVGTLTRDTTVYVDGTRTENFGGTHYTVRTLVSLFAGAARIVPVANVGADALRITRAALDLPGVDRAHLREVPQSNNHVYLTYRDAEERDEILQGMVPPIELAQLQAVAEVDTVLVNMTSGRDVLLPTLQAFRRAYKGNVQLDVHSLTLGFDESGRRVLELPEDWPDWMACVDWVQMNEVEADLLRDGQSQDAFLQRVVDLGPKGVLITLGSRGSLVGMRTPRGLQVHHQKAYRSPEPSFATGCGDVFGAAFAYAQLMQTPATNAAAFANAVAGRKAAFESPDEVLRLATHARSEMHRWIPTAEDC